MRRHFWETLAMIVIGIAAVNVVAEMVRAHFVLIVIAALVYFGLREWYRSSRY